MKSHATPSPLFAAGLELAYEMADDDVNDVYRFTTTPGDSILSVTYDGPGKLETTPCWLPPCLRPTAERTGGDGAATLQPGG